MPNAAIQFQTLNPTWDMAGLRLAVRNLLTGHCGFTLVEEYGTTTFYTVVNFDTVDPGSTNKNVFLRFNSTTAVSSFQVEIFSTWNTSSRPADNSGSGSEAAPSFATGQPLILMAVSHPECRGVFIANGTVISPMIFCGYWKPAIKPSWWPSNMLYAFTSSAWSNNGTHAFRGLFGAASPFNHTVGIFYPVIREANMWNPVAEFGNVRSVDAGAIKMFVMGLKGTAGIFSNDLALVSGTGLLPCVDDISIGGTPTWQIIHGGSTAQVAAWAIKIA